MSGDAESLRVLVVDDERGITDSLVIILRMRGYTARGAYSAVEAVLMIDDFNPHAVISDVVMPGMSGIDLAIHLAERLPDCKVLLMSGNAYAGELMEKSLRQGYPAHSILPKPVHPQQIFEFIASCKVSS